jgi:decaprenylphospho-beta-D-ribofuranose 2-oxidase
MSDPARTVLTGWGRTAPTSATVLRPRDGDQVADMVRRAGPRGVLARGLGRSYGDAAQDAGGTVLDLTALDTVDVDAETGLAACGGGASLWQVMQAAIPLGWFPPVLPGTRHVTVGGALATDVHGKNHHRSGSFASHVRSMTLVGADGEARRLESADPLSQATAGGMGLTGIVTDLVMSLRPVESSFMQVDTTRAPDLDALMAQLEAADAAHPYTVAWVDCLTGGRRLGRGIVYAGDHAAPADLPEPERAAALRFEPPTGLPAPTWTPAGLLNPHTAAAFNEAWFRKAPRDRRQQLQTISTFFHPLDGVRGWNRLYGHAGFVQYQLVVPFAEGGVVRKVIERLSSARAATVLAVLKRLGASSPGPLSFPMPGWTLTVDMPARGRDLARLLDGLDQLVADAGGRVYLAKDARLRPELVAEMYPRVGEWLELRSRVDPHGCFVSDLARRLGL